MVGDMATSPNGNLYAYSIDIKGNESYFIYVKVKTNVLNSKIIHKY